MEVLLNGEKRSVDDGLTVQDLLAGVLRTSSATGIAVALNGEILHRNDYSSTRIKAGDALEIVQMTAGG